jgi:hypothetical protein
MTKRAPGLAFDRVGDDFIIRRTTEGGKTNSLRLSREEATTLASAAPALMNAILQSLPEGGGMIRYAVTIPVDAFEISEDALGENVVMALAPPSGSQTIYLLRKAGARQLASGLLEMVSHMDGTLPTRQ